MLLKELIKSTLVLYMEFNSFNSIMLLRPSCLASAIGALSPDITELGALNSEDIVFSFGFLNRSERFMSFVKVTEEPYFFIIMLCLDTVD